MNVYIITIQFIRTSHGLYYLILIPIKIVCMFYFIFSAWGYKCVEDKNCVRMNISELEEPKSYHACHLTCGNSVLWPYPSGQVSISKTLVPVNPHSVSIESSSSHKTGSFLFGRTKLIITYD